METARANKADYSFLDQREFRATYAIGERHNEMRLYIGGIRCSKCVRSLENLPLEMTGLRRLEVEIGTNLAHIEVEPGVLPLSKVADRIAEMGFEPIPLRREQGVEIEETREDRSDLTRLGVAGACAGNIMGFAFANYFGATGEWASLFSWLSFALYLPVVTFVAWPFYRGAWRSLRTRQISIDLPMAVASLTGFAYSLAQLIRGGSEIYFDSLSGFLFLILVSRFVQKRLQRLYLRPRDLSEGLNLQKARQVGSNGWTWRPLEAIGTGDRLLLHAPETLPAEAELLSTRAHFSMAWLSGEAQPRTFLRGSLVPAGARLLSGEAHLTVRKPLAETAFGRILSEVQRFSLSRNQIVSRSDRWAQILLATVFMVAVGFSILYWNHSPEEAVRRALALIILACPCAMAFGTPLALASSLRRARRHGLVIRDANVFERVENVRTLFFDKTGTLTDSDLSLVTDASDVANVYQKIILSLENESLHPIAFAFRKAFRAQDRLPPVDGFKETPGSGVSGFLFGRHYELKREPTADGVGCALYEDDHRVMTFRFEARLKPDCAGVLKSLRARGYRLILMSGDSRNAVEHMAKFLGFAADEIFYEFSPEEKARMVAQTPHSMMIGDGINDSLALMRSHVGVAVSGGVEAALKSAPVYIGEPGLSGVIHLLDISRMALTSIRQNLSVSLAYNVTGGAFALLGFINPFVAALLMPLSSGLILLSTWLRGRR